MSDAPTLDAHALEATRTRALGEIDRADDLSALDEARVELLGRKGRITELAKSLGRVAPEQRRELGQAINAIKADVQNALSAKKEVLETRALEDRLARETVDIGLPVRPRDQGRVHPVSQVTEEIVAVFAEMGFAVAEGPDIENDFRNFTALNFPDSHPARDMHDTFFLDLTEADGKRYLLRTHTSPVQIRTMMAGPPPHRVIIPGRTYRCDSDQTHTPMFHQVEGLLIDRVTHMGHLKGCLTEFVRAFFERDTIPVRFRPSYFPFTEPSAEMDIGCKRTKDELIVGEGDDWLEILGCGMVHPNVLKNCGLDPDEWQGFAFGLGIDRVAMLKYGIPDLRTFFDGDLRWAQHYGFVPLDRPSVHGGLSK